MHRFFGHQHERRGRHPFGGRGGPGGEGEGFRGGGRHGGHEGRGGRGGRIGRFLEHGDLRFVILALLEEQPRHGYELIKELENRTGGAYRPSPGVIYPTLSLLEDEGFIRPVVADATRKLYEATDAGREALAANKPMVDAVFSRMDEAAEGSETTRPRIGRAMGNLGLALRSRLSQRPVTPEQLDAVVKIIDEAAAAIEKV